MAEDQDDTDIDVLELGDRAAYWQLRDELGRLYAELPDRVWSVALGCFAKCVTSLGPENVPAQWYPAIDEHGMWTGMERHG